MKKLISSICMVTGTTIGGGMVVLPAVVGIYGYYSAISLLVAVWLVNTIIALIFLEANCYLPPETNLISMSKRLLGRYGEWVAWIVCLIFLYTIMSTYTAGVTEIIGSFFEKNLFPVSSYYIAVLSMAMVSVPIYFGMTYISFVNRFIVFSMFVAFFMLTFFIMPHIGVNTLLAAPAHLPIMALPIVFTSFGFLIIIPSLRSYLNDNLKHLKISIIIGSLIPLVVYSLWLTVVMGVIPTLGEDSLQSILVQAEPVKSISTTLIFHTGNVYVSYFIQIFILFAIVSSFIGTSLGLYDFLSDGLNVSKTSIGKMKLLALTFLPPLFITLSQNHLFIIALGFAGLLSTILFGIYPVMLAWSGRYIHKLNTNYRVSVNRFVLLMIVVFSLVIIAVELFLLSK